MRLLLKLIKYLFSLIILMGCLLSYAIFIEPKLLTVEEVPVTTKITQSNTGQQLTIAQFSDTHLGFQYDLAQLEKAIIKINAAEPDLVVFTGDLIDHAKSYDHLDKIGAVLAKIKAPLGKFAVYGNHDYGGGAEKHYKDIMNEGGFHLLVNEATTLTLANGKKICLAGLDEAMLGNPNPAKVSATFSPVAVNILLMHEPDLIDAFAQNLPQLTISGHSHGGQVQIPFYGPLITTTLAETYTGKSYLLGAEKNKLLYVNTGLGTTKLPMRFADIPSVTVFTLDL